MKRFDLDIILFTTSPRAYASKRLREETKKLQINLKVIEFKDINIVYTNGGLLFNLKGKIMPIPKGVLLRGLGEDGIYNPIRTALIKRFNFQGSKVLNERSFDKWPSLDKTTQYINLSTAGIPIVESFSFSSIEELNRWSKKSYPFIAKDVVSSRGAGVFRISNDFDLLTLLKNYNSNFKIKSLLFQRFLPNAMDLRVVILGGRILGGMERIAKKGNYLTNYSQGADIQKYNLKNDKAAQKISLLVSKLFKLDYCGVDLMRNSKGNWVVLEVNRACQFEGFEKATGINVAEQIVEYLTK